MTASTIDLTVPFKSRSGFALGALILQALTQAKADITALLAGAGAAEGASLKVRGVMTTLGAGACVSGVYTATANGAMAAQDGLTIAVNDLVLLQEGTTNLPSAADAGPYVVTAIGAAGAKVVLTRPSWWAHGATVQPGARIHVAAGTLWANSEWKVCAAAALVVGTTAPSLYPRTVSQSLTLVAGTKTISNVPLLSATKSSIAFSRTTPDTCTLTVGGYDPTTLTAGVIGTASIVVQAKVGAGTINNADISVMTITVNNW